MIRILVIQYYSTTSKQILTNDRGRFSSTFLLLSISTYITDEKVITILISKEEKETSNNEITLLPIINFTYFDLRLGSRVEFFAHSRVSSNVMSSFPRVRIIFALLPQHMRLNKFSWLSRYNLILPCKLCKINDTHLIYCSVPGTKYCWTPKQ